MFELKNFMQDKITGFYGIVIAKCEYLSKETEYLIQPPLNENGVYKEPVWFNEGRLALISTNINDAMGAQGIKRNCLLPSFLPLELSATLESIAEPKLFVRHQ
ncbi:hypothetical protein [Campylobacter sp. RM16190]|uniref:hypothetical protein n=1 Tax=Campylobacter sp. RM16190 TaxID=1705727 RepID=UPI0014754783|nr:hypothetical protein [Campylobacter sp. RM16190]